MSNFSQFKRKKIKTQLQEQLFNKVMDSVKSDDSFLDSIKDEMVSELEQNIVDAEVVEVIDYE